MRAASQIKLGSKVMNFPTYDETSRELLQLIYENNGEVVPRACYKPLGYRFGLSDDDMSRSLDQIQGYGGKRPKWSIMVQWARNSLVKQGMLLKPALRRDYDRWKLTPAGLAEAAKSALSSFPIIFADETESGYFEGARKQVYVSVYERSQSARAKCIDHWGTRCSVCAFSFLELYGERGCNFIHVHHLKPIHEINQVYQLDPINDLRPVCPNCHAMHHKTTPPCSIEDLKEIIHSPKARGD
jgi:5-methylcytosine-specific restriction protein A